jgi:hypothetical protein
LLEFFSCKNQGNYCKPNKDHATCGKERFIGNPDRRAVTLRFRVKWLGWNE